MPSNISNRYLLAGCAACALSAPAISYAQTAAPSAGTGKPLEEIVVTATRVKTAESKTPISMEVFSSAAIAQKGITDIQSLATQDASVNFASGGGEATIGIRGIASENATEIGDPSVPVGTDGFFLNRPYTYNESLYDVARIEVLRGPQGTLFGRNATGGLINVIDTAPTKKIEGYQEFTIGDYGTFNATGAANIPVTDTFQTRIAYSSLAHEGYRDNGAVGHGDNQDAKSVRVRFAWEPSDAFRANVTLQYTKVMGTGADGVLDPILVDSNGVIDNNVNYKTYGNNPHNYTLSSQSALNIEERAVRWDLSYSALPWGITATYLGGYDLLDWKHNGPQTFPGEPLSDLPGLDTNGVGTYQQSERPATQNHEFRLSSSQDQKLTWQVGAFFFDEVNPIYSAFTVNYGHAPNVGPIAFGPSPGNPNPNGAFPFIFFKWRVHTTSAAGYGQATYKLGDNIRITGGVRYTADAKTRNDGGSALPIFGVAGPVDQNGQWNKITWHAGVDYTPTSDWLIYAKADKGYKSGGLNNQGQPNYAPETVLAFEAGAKGRLLDGQVRVNGDVFYEDYKNQQLNTFVPLGAGGITAILNAGQSTIYGLDVGAHGNVADLATVDVSATYLHARFGDNVILANSGVLTSGSVKTDVSGEQLPQAPDLTFTAGVEKSFPAFTGSLTPRFDTKFVSTEYLVVFNYPYTRVAPHAVSNIYLRYDDDKGRYLVELYVHNLTNETVLNNASQDIGQHYNLFGFDPPRTFGARLRVNF